jgi:hypothetical protein
MRASEEPRSGPQRNAAYLGRHCTPAELVSALLRTEPTLTGSRTPRRIDAAAAAIG